MPWCETCSRFFNPNSLATDGTCPSCGRAVDDASWVATAPEMAPGHFKLLLVAVVVYLVWRVIQMIGWLI
jgi:hypothetical protein